MFQRDYLLRMIEQAMQVLAKALGLIAKKELDQAEQALGAAYTAAGIDRELVRSLDADSLCAFVGKEKRAALIELLGAEAKLAAARGEPARAQRHARTAARLAELELPARQA